MATNAYIPPIKTLKIWQAGLLVDESTIAPLPDKNIFLEIGPGNGAFVLNQCLANPDNYYIAIELKYHRFNKICIQAAKHKLTNLCIVKGDARVALQQLFKPAMFNAIYILFPDPWPKRAHGKHRLIKSYFVEFLQKYLNPQGKIFVATDHSPYAEEIAACFEANGNFNCQKGQSLFPTYFESLWKRQGKDISYFEFALNLST